MTIDPIQVIINNEGSEYTDIPGDNGGPTKYGITQNTLSNYLGRQATPEDVQNLTEDVAYTIYEQKYLTGPHIDQLPDPIKTQILDWGVNAGPSVAIKHLQGVLNQAGFGPLTVDGGLGPHTVTATVTALNQMGPLLSNALVDDRISFYTNLANENPNDQKFLQGWINRANEFRLPVNS